MEEKMRFDVVEGDSGGGVIVLVEIQEVRDADALGQYQQGVAQAIASFGGKVIGRTGDTYLGSPPFGRLVAQHWPSAQAFAKWQASDVYAPLKVIREKAMKVRIAILDN